MSLICVPIMVHDAAAALADAHAAKAGGADLVELRIDEFFDAALAGAEGGDEGGGERGGEIDATLVAVLDGLIAECPLPCVLTCRASAEGGGFDGDDAARISLLERLTAASKHPPTYLDVEWSSFSRSANLAQKVRLCVQHAAQLREQPTRLVLSTHDFQSRPADLSRRIAGMAAEPACSVVKAAWRARSLHDAIEALEMPGQTGKPTVAIAMGEYGVMSRVLAPKFGGLLTFAPLRPSGATAPGQPTLAELAGLYRFRAITRATSVYGVIGHPVTHSLSPLVHNAGFGHAGHDGVYVPMPIAAYDDAEATYAGFKAAVMELVEHPGLDFCGASVTMPHKENLVRLAKEAGWGLDDTSRDIGAANTLVVERENPAAARIRVMNTDVPALAQELDAALGVLPGGQIGDVQGHDAQVRIGVIGAGGMGKAAAYACARAGAHVVIYNRDGERARRVVAEIEPCARAGAKVVAAEMHLLPRACCNAFIQCTPLGLSGSGLENLSAIPIHDMHACPRGVVVIDTVYNPLVTPTLMAAQEKGWSAVGGVGIFVRQAVMQLEAWLGAAGSAVKAESGTMKLYERLVRGRLGSAAGTGRGGDGGSGA